MNELIKMFAPFRGFFLTFISVLGLFGLAFTKGVDINATLPVVLGLYLGAKTGEKMSAHAAASRDPSCSTAEVISQITEK
jgi:uncharacterized membrane protein YfcA